MDKKYCVCVKMFYSKKIFWFLLLISYIIAVNGLNITQSNNNCLAVINGTNVSMNIGETWNIDDSCINYSCEYDANEIPYIKSNEDYCLTKCNNEGELTPEEEKCCDKCEDQKCKDNNQYFNIGDTWKSANNCTLLECSIKDGKQVITSYERVCPDIIACPPENIYTENCCEYCHNDAARYNENATDEFIDYKVDLQHPCVRECKDNGQPMECFYTFTVEMYETLSKACYNCPYNDTDCNRPHCISADGIRRNVIVINRMMPGPTIEVCEGDTIIVDVENQLVSESTTIHWHGLHQRDNPYMDGVPHISQCAILPGSTFRYQFTADNPGTHFWHSHIGMQRGDGAFGALIIKQTPNNNYFYGFYDYDLSDHLIMLQDWSHTTAASLFYAHHHSFGTNKASNILINGKGRIFNPQNTRVKPPKPKTEAPVVEESDITFTTENTSTSEINLSEVDITTTELLSETTTIIDVDINDTIATTFLSTSEDFDSNTTESISEDVEFFQDNTEQSLKLASENSSTIEDDDSKNRTDPNVYVYSNRQKRAYEIKLNSDESKFIPYQVYNVLPGKRYRFRLINAEFLNCPMELSIDNHTLTIISSDSYDIKPVEVDKIATYAGERFDFILKTSEEVDNYWIRIKGLLDCDERFGAVHQVAILRYQGADENDPTETPTYEYQRDGILLNALNTGTGNNDKISIAEVNNVFPDDNRFTKTNADYKFYIYYDFYRKDNPHYHVPNLYGFNDVTNNASRLFTPQLNHITMKMPGLPLMPAKDIIDESLFCNSYTLAKKGIDCETEFCECSHVLQVPLNSLVELVLVDEGFAFDANHPFHLHGYAFTVVAMERLGSNISINEIKELDKNGKIQRRLKGAPIKDTVTIPDGGYTIIRFYADNPGYWLFHCHIEFHAEIGMSLVFKVGKHSQMISMPENFPKCSDYKPNFDLKSNNFGGKLNSTLWMLVISLIKMIDIW